MRAGKSGMLRRDRSQDARTEGTFEDSDIDQSSSTMLESPSSHTVKRSRKRKREGTTVIDQPAMVELHGGGYVNGGLLYEALCGALGQIIQLTEAHFGDAGDFASEHMRAVLRVSPDEVAKMLGPSMYMLSWIIEQRRTLHENRSNEPLDPFSLFLSPMVALWDLRSGGADDLAGQTSNVSSKDMPCAKALTDRSQQHAFSAQCLMPALHLLLQCEATKHDVLVSTTTHMLEQLIARYVIIPARAALLEIIHPGKRLNNGVVAPLMEELFHPLRLECSRELEDDFLHGTRDLSTGTLVMIPMTFHLVVRCTPLDTAKRRTAEMPWLENIFIYLARCASISVFAPTSSPPAKLSLRVLEKMLEIAITSEVYLDASTLERIVSAYSGIVSKELSEMNWKLVGLCLKLDPNVFLMPFSSTEKGKIRPAGPGSVFLAPLLAKITSVGWRTLQEIPVLYRTVLSDIVLPLVAAFAQSRGLDRFIEHWQEQLRISEDSQRISIADLTIWEDEELLDLVARLLEPSLTTGQIEKVFHVAYVDLEKQFAVNADNVSAMAWVSSVIIECIVDGCTKETVTDKLSSTAQVVYYSSLRILQEVPYRVTKLRWRLWRVAASMRSHWPEISSPRRVSAAEAAAESGALERASNTLLNSTGSMWLAQDCIERLQAFKFILSFAATVHGAQLETSSPQREIELAIQWVISWLQNELEQIDSNRDPWWDGKAITATSQGALLIGCVTQLILSPKALR